MYANNKSLLSAHRLWLKDAPTDPWELLDSFILWEATRLLGLPVGSITVQSGRKDFLLKESRALVATPAASPGLYFVEVKEAKEYDRTVWDYIRAHLRPVLDSYDTAQKRNSWAKVAPFKADTLALWREDANRVPLNALQWLLPPVSVRLPMGHRVALWGVPARWDELPKWQGWL